MGMNVRVFVIYCGNVQHNIVELELTFCRICGNVLEIVFEAMNSSDKASFILGRKLREEYFEPLLALVKGALT